MRWVVVFHYIWREQLRANFGGRDSTGVHQLDLCSRLSSKDTIRRRSNECLPMLFIRLANEVRMQIASSSSSERK
ncbi:hypothetical protein MPTK2_1g00790 [Marchantia polymorpha subsp. ruderalis]